MKIKEKRRKKREREERREGRERRKEKEKEDEKEEGRPTCFSVLGAWTLTSSRTFPLRRFQACGPCATCGWMTMR